MSSYSRIPNITKEDAQRLSEITSWTGEGTIVVKQNGVVVEPISPIIDFVGASVASVNGDTVVTITGGGGSAYNANFQAVTGSPNVTLLSGSPGDEHDLAMFDSLNYEANGSDWTIVDDFTLISAAGAGKYKVSVRLCVYGTSIGGGGIAYPDLNVSVDGVIARSTHFALDSGLFYDGFTWVTYVDVGATPQELTLTLSVGGVFGANDATANLSGSESTVFIEKLS